MEPVSMDRFEELVGQALDELPESLAARIDNVVVCIEPRHPSEDLLGLYEGIPLTEREDYGMMELPDTITLYRDPICAISRDEAEVVEEVRITVVHEVAHHFGIDDDALHDLGWA
jgi:predicted Zn-dependent protease with MMP-like domain